MAEYWRRSRQARGLHIRFSVYADAFEANKHEITWQPGVDVQALLRAGGSALRDMGSATDKPALDPAVAELDRVVRALAAADDWTRKLAPLLRNITPAARQAFDELVKRGCVPLELAKCLEAQTQFVETEEAFRKERLVYLPRLKDMEREFRLEDCRALASSIWRCERVIRVRNIRFERSCPRGSQRRPTSCATVFETPMHDGKTRFVMVSH